MLIIENYQLKVQINELGAEIVHLIDKTKNFDLIWNGSDWEHHAPIYFPAVGYLNNNQYLFNGSTFDMPEYGFAQKYNWTVVDKGDDRVTLTLTENEETLKNYPFKFNLMVTYFLEGNQLKIKFHVINNSDKVMPFGLGFAPGFNLPLADDKFKFSDYHISFLPEIQELTQFEIIENKFRNGKVEPVKKAQNSVLPLAYSEFKEGCILVNNPGLTSGTITSEKSEHEIKITLEDFPYVGIATIPEEKAKFVCIELLNGLPDKKSSDLIEWADKEGNNLLEAGEQKEFQTTLTFV